ncbi:MAG: type II toxin-antitoxin system VapC family toxin [Paludisphaera borealis]|uniref:type II toxin-antitoxin system VapC family toxin n=1 Tax=Paludisphaera borealis TaxID=1387353 RepID=UPI0028489FD0|nr:type II toxin-antitoxin system VapC family toxin [Paludisphaera borealis]MDR3619160.1 type II toxin-antitoxin system VapC family toxin [Paludisphaera borealis]
MNLLLDTHAVLWFWWDDARLSATALNLIRDPMNRKLVSPGSAWEVAIKVSLRKLDIGGLYRGLFPQQMHRTNFEWLPIHDDHLAVVSSLPFHHKDPFDRLMIAQAIWEKLPIISADSAFDDYSVVRLW